MKTDTIKDKFGEIMENHGFLSSEMEEFFMAMSEILDFIADETEKEEPYAQSSIEKFRSVASDVYDVDNAAESINYK